MDLVDEEDIPRLQVGQNGGEIARPLQHRARGLAQVHAELARDDVRERGLAQARRPEEQHVVERFAAPARRLDEDLELPAHLFLADVFGERRRAQRALDLLFVRRGRFGRDQPVGFDSHPGILPDTKEKAGSRPAFAASASQTRAFRT